jgi:hypothetical protein
VSRTRPRRLIDGQQLALLPLSIEEDAAQLDLVAEYGVEILAVASITTAPDGMLF